jgi:hypothetical protein
MNRPFTAFALAVACVSVFAQGAAARNPGGRDYGGAIFSAGVSGTDGARVAPRAAAIALGSLFRVSDDSGLPDTLAPWELNQSGRAFINSETEPWADVNPADPTNLLGMFQEDRWSTGGARNLTFAYSNDRGETWTNIPIQGLSRHYCGFYERVTDPWLEF